MISFHDAQVVTVAPPSSGFYNIVMRQSMVGQRIEQRLQELGRNQKWLAEQLGSHPSRISRWIDGARQMRVCDLQRVARELGRSPAWFLDASDLDGVVIYDLAEFAQLQVSTR